jgi:hypothetical protein
LFFSFSAPPSPLSFPSSPPCMWKKIRPCIIITSRRAAFLATAVGPPKYSIFVFS